jgi:arylsulfatase A-like enzyme
LTLGREMENGGVLGGVFSYQQILGRISAERLTEDFLAWLSGQPKRPLFAFLNYFDVHEPYLPPRPFDTLFASNPRPRRAILHTAVNLSPEEIQAEMDAYDGCMAYMDQHLGHLFDQLTKWGWLDNTLVIITSDHGEQFGEHGFMSHGQSLYFPLLHVPLVVLFPGRVPAGVTVANPVSLRDLPATVADLLKLEKRPGMPGTSLARFWANSPTPSSTPMAPLLSEANYIPRFPKIFPASRGNMRSLVADRYHYIRNGDGVEELYDHWNDVLEMDNLVTSAGIRSELDFFRASLQVIAPRG